MTSEDYQRDAMWPPSWQRRGRRSRAFRWHLAMIFKHGVVDPSSIVVISGDEFSGCAAFIP